MVAGLKSWTGGGHFAVSTHSCPERRVLSLLPRRGASLGWRKQTPGPDPPASLGQLQRGHSQ